METRIKVKKENFPMWYGYGEVSKTRKDETPYYTLEVEGLGTYYFYIDDPDIDHVICCKSCGEPMAKVRNDYLPYNHNGYGMWCRQLSEEHEEVTGCDGDVG